MSFPVDPWVWGRLAASFLLALAVGLYATPLARRAALRFGIVDRPDGKLKQQSEPVAYLGGLAVGLSLLVSLALTYDFSKEVLAVLLAASTMLVLGLVDDLGALSPRTKLLGQLVAVIVLLKAGIFIQLTFLPLWLRLALSALWMLSVINAFNLIDVMDGLSASVGAVAALILAAVSVGNGRLDAAAILLALVGALLGFLRMNWNPARIYLGDAGSLLVGLVLGALAMNNSYTVENQLAALAPALILGVPLFDMLFVMWVRWRRGMPVMLGSPDHVALRLRRWRLSVGATVLANVTATALLGACAVLMMFLDLRGAAITLGALAGSGLLLALWLYRLDLRL
jgi:UDP-GlcNAc:undecaprenyl-phosphate GlcNAc-1-phosphate transferase